jgi:hypothetical protein
MIPCYHIFFLKTSHTEARAANDTAPAKSELGFYLRFLQYSLSLLLVKSELLVSIQRAIFSRAIKYCFFLINTVKTYPTLSLFTKFSPMDLGSEFIQTDIPTKHRQ